MELIEITFVLGILLLVFGPKKLPKLARDLGLAIQEFRKASSQIEVSSGLNAPVIRRDLEVIAEKLGIEIKGKTIYSISEEIRSIIESDVKVK